MTREEIVLEAKQIAGEKSGYALRVIPDDMPAPKIGQILPTSFIWQETEEGEQNV